MSLRKFFVHYSMNAPVCIFAGGMINRHACHSRNELKSIIAIQYRRLKADGTPENVPMYPSEFATRLSDLRMLDYSAMPVTGCSIEDFDIVEIERLRSLILSYSGDKSLLDLSNDELFKALGFVREINSQLVPTITGLLLVGKDSTSTV